MFPCRYEDKEANKRETGKQSQWKIYSRVKGKCRGRETNWVCLERQSERARQRAQEERMIIERGDRMIEQIGRVRWQYRGRKGKYSVQHKRLRGDRWLQGEAVFANFPTGFPLQKMCCVILFVLSLFCFRCVTIDREMGGSAVFLLSELPVSSQSFHYLDIHSLSTSR